MPVERHIGFWLAALVIVTLALYVLREVLLPFVAGMALAYVLDPVADRLERLGLGRLGATILILALFVLAFVLALVLLIPLAAHQMAAFVANLPAYVERFRRSSPSRAGRSSTSSAGPARWPTCKSPIGDLVSAGRGLDRRLSARPLVRGQAIISVFALLVVTPVVAFYLLVDWDHMVAARRWMAAAPAPRHHPQCWRARSTGPSRASSAARLPCVLSSGRFTPSGFHSSG